MKIEILGAGCPKCGMLAANAEQAARELGMEAEIVKVTRLEDIMNYGVMLTPALAVDGVVRSEGKALSVEDIKGMLA